MKHVSILIPLGHSSLPNIDGTHQIFGEVNNLLVSMGKEPLFKLQLVGLEKETVQRNGMYVITPDVLMKDVKKTDLIIIPAMHGDLKQSIERNKAFLPWISKQYNAGAEVASFCIGTFFLAETGLLNGKRCATHWRFASEFRAQYPGTKLMDDRIMTEDDGIYTSGGAYSYVNLVAYLVEKFAGREIAIAISKMFMIDIDRSSQSPFIIFEGQKTHEDEPVKKAQMFIENNYHEKISVDQLTGMLALSRRNFERRFKKATANTVTEYIQRVKMEAAKKSFETNRKNVNEVMYDVGYSDNKAFRTVFRNITGLSPLEYRKKYNKEEAVR
ncbi:MAG: helix-turn-helix domain-containing protein [Ferruginibacter sp.]